MLTPVPRRIIGVYLMLLITGLVSGADDLRLTRAVVPTSESVHLTLDAGKPGYTGSVRVELQVNEPVTDFRLHAEEMSLGRVTLTTAGGDAIDVTTRTGEQGLLTIVPARPLAPGRATLAIEFENEFDTRAVGLYRMEFDGAGYAFTQFEAVDARKGFPCWDEPSFKIPYQITLTVPEAHKAITNTPEESSTVKDGWRTTVFARTRPLPSYLLAIATGPLETVDIPGMSVPGRVVTVKGHSGLAATAVKMTPPLLAALEKYFDRPYPFEKLDLIAVPEYWPGAMENPGAITFSEAILLVDPKAASVAQRSGLAGTTAHELAHMWFGDLVTMKWWDDLWLNESFADWMGDKIAHQVYPEFHADLAELQSIQGTMIGDSRPSSQAIRRDVKSGDNMLQNVGLAYNKGKSVLGMFERWLGEEKFRKGVLDYLHRNEWGNAEAADLWSALSKVSGDDVTGAMATFIDQNGVPLVSVESIEAGVVKLSQRRFLNQGVTAEPRQWRIPVTLRYPDGEGIGTKTVILTDQTRTIDLGVRGRVDWILPDVEASGYYRWSVPPPALMTLADRSTQVLSARERIAYIGNLAALMNAGMIHGDEYLTVLSKFAADPEPRVISALAGALGSVKQAFVPAGLEEPYARYVRQTLGPALERVGLENHAGEDESVSAVRPQLLGWLGDEGADAKVMTHAEKLARAYLADPTAIDPSVAGTVLALSANRGDKTLFDEYRRRFETAKVPAERGRFLAALGNFRQPALMEEAIKYSLEGPLRPQEVFQLTGGLSDTEAGRDRLYRFVTENYAAITSKLPPDFAGFLPFVAGGCEPARLEAAKTFFAEPAHSVQGTARTMAQVTDQVSDCVRLREREGAAVKRYLTDASR